MSGETTTTSDNDGQTRLARGSEIMEGRARRQALETSGNVGLKPFPDIDVPELYPSDYAPPSLLEALRESGIPNADQVASICLDFAQKKLQSTDFKAKYPDLNPDDVAVIHMYTLDSADKSYDPPYILINTALETRDQGKLLATRHLIWKLLTALRKLNRTKINPLYRGINKTLDYEKDDTVCWHRFTSTTLDLAVTSDFRKTGEDGGKGAFFILSDTWGYDIKDFSSFPEEELLKEPECVFSVFSVTDNMYHLKPVDNPVLLSKRIPFSPTATTIEVSGKKNCNTKTAGSDDSADLVKLCAKNPELDKLLTKHPEIRNEVLNIDFNRDRSRESLTLEERKLVCDLLKKNAIPAKTLLFTRLDRSSDRPDAFACDGDTENAHLYSMMIADVLMTNTNLTALTVIGSDPNEEGNPMILEALKNNTTISELGFSITFTREEDVEALGALLKENHTLKTLNLTFSPMEESIRNAFLALLIVHTTITKLGFSHQRVLRNGMDDRGGVAVSAVLKKNSTLTDLDLSNNEIGILGQTKIFEALKTNSSLKALNLAGCRKVFGRPPPPEQNVAQLVREVMTTNKTLTHLDLDNSTLGETAGVFIAESLKTNNTLEFLSLQQCGLQPNAGIAIGEALKVNTTLTSLNLSYNLLKREGTKPIALGFEKNNTLKALYLSHAIFHKEGVLIFTEALKVNTALTVLDVSGNEFGRKRTKMISDALKVNKTLKTLILRENHISDKEAVVLSEALKINQTLTSLDVNCNYCTPAGTDALRSAAGSQLTTLDLSNQGKQPDNCSIM